MSSKGLGNLRVAYLASFPARECGIATFTYDLVTAIEQLTGTPAIVAAMNDRPEGYAYDSRVRLQIARDQRICYPYAARAFKYLPVDVINVQHEYGLFGGQYGEYLLDFYRAAKQPILTTLHTVLPNPDAAMRRVTRELAAHSAKVIVLANAAIPILTRDYGIPREKVAMIPHGVPTVNYSQREHEGTKSKLGYRGRKTISTFGLISPNKGIEYALRALPAIVRSHPDVVYLIVGKTHPGVRAFHGESYRDQLNALVRERHLESHVRFVDRYLALEEIVEYLIATDVYLVPYLNPHQIVSGTLAYAVGAGKAIVATPSMYAHEVLADGRGIIVPFRDSAAIALQVNRLLSNPVERSSMELAAYLYSRGWTWNAVGAQYLDLFSEIVHSEIPCLAA